MSDLLAQVHVVLLRPRWASNLGSVARAMKNFALRRLTIVQSCIGSWADAYKMAVKAGDLLDGAVQTDDLGTALADARWIVGTSNAPPAGAEVLTPRDVARLCRERGAPTLLFGSEITGLEPAELLRCHSVAAIPAAAEQSSLNLAQAVCVFGAELYQELAAGGEPVGEPIAPAAPAAMLARLETLLTATLQDSAWADASRSRHAIAELLQPLYRARLTEAEVRAWLIALQRIGQVRRRGGGG
jgi:TrmH family RNA methyltransferase